MFVVYIFQFGVYKWELIAAGATDMSTPHTHVNLWSVIADNDNDFHNILHFMLLPENSVDDILFFSSSFHVLNSLFFCPQKVSQWNSYEIFMNYCLTVYISADNTKKVDCENEWRNHLLNQNRFRSLLCCLFHVHVIIIDRQKYGKLFHFLLYRDACEYVIDFSDSAIAFEWLNIHNRRYLIRHVCCNGNSVVVWGN